jgi:N,N'-diacetylchitobiose transport system substrate-binding protein
MKRRPVAVVAVALALVASSCSGGGEAAGGKGEIAVWIMEPGAPELKQFFEQATRDFELEHDGARVKVQFVPWATAHDQFLTAVGGRQVPDVAEMGSTWTPEFGDAGALAPVKTDLGDRYVRSLVEGATVDDQVYGLPWYAGARALIYRKDVLDSLGLAAPVTWDELLAAGRAVRDKAKLFAFGVAGNGNHYFLPMVWQNGGQLAIRQGDRWFSRMDSPPAVQAIQFYADLYRVERFAPEGALSWNARDVRAAFEAGNLAMMIGGGWDLQAILESHPELAGKVATALLPAGPSGSRETFAGGSHLVVFEESEHKELARAYREFLLEPARVAAFAGKIGFLPGTTEGLRAQAATAPPPFATFTTQLEAHSRTYPPARQWGSFEADGLFVNAVQQVMKGERTAAQAMSEVAAAMNKAFGEAE